MVASPAQVASTAQSLVNWRIRLPAEDHDLEETVSTRLLVMSQPSWLAAGFTPRQACRCRHRRCTER